MLRNAERSGVREIKEWQAIMDHLRKLAVKEPGSSPSCRSMGGPPRSGPSRWAERSCAFPTHRDRVQNASKLEGSGVNLRVLAWTRRSANSAERWRNPGATRVCPIGDPELITRRSQVQILPPQFGLLQTSAIVSSRR